MTRDAATWSDAPERGSGFWLRAAVTFYRLFGRRLTFAALYPIAAYFFLTAGTARRASRNYLLRLYETSTGSAAPGERPGWRDTARHFFCFAQSVYDRMNVALGAGHSYRFDYRGDAYLREIVESKRGGILLGSHFGSFEMLRALATQHDVTINVVMFTRHAARIQRTIHRLDPSVDMRVINLNSGKLGSAFEIRARLRRGELVGILADRIPPLDRSGTISCDFLGAPARFARGPFELAAMLGFPVLMTTGIRIGPDHYEVVAEPLYDGKALGRRERVDEVPKLVAQYAARLEAWCRRAPYQWFNFYDFWGV